MTKAELRKLNGAMARFLVRLCRDSDNHYNGYRTAQVDANYMRAVRLIKRAGLKYTAVPCKH